MKDAPLKTKQFFTTTSKSTTRQKIEWKKIIFRHALNLMVRDINCKFRIKTPARETLKKRQQLLLYLTNHDVKQE